MADFLRKIFTLNDIPEKRQYLFDRVRKIYKGVTDEQINGVLDAITIAVRDMDEKGASNHLRKQVFIGPKEIQRYKLNDEDRFLKYLASPVSPITHEITHMFQNLFDVWPHVQYTIPDDEGGHDIDYKKYVTDKGEIHARLEQVVELLKWGFDKEEIVNFLYNRRYKDQELWRNMVDHGLQIKNKYGASKVPSGKDDDFDSDCENTNNNMRRKTKTHPYKSQRDNGTNYEKSYNP